MQRNVQLIVLQQQTLCMSAVEARPHLLLHVQPLSLPLGLWRRLHQGYAGGAGGAGRAYGRVSGSRGGHCLLPGEHCVRYLHSVIPVEILFPDADWGTVALQLGRRHRPPPQVTTTIPETINAQNLGYYPHIRRLKCSAVCSFCSHSLQAHTR